MRLVLCELRSSNVGGVRVVVRVGVLLLLWVLVGDRDGDVLV